MRVWRGSLTDPFDLFPPGCAERIAVSTARRAVFQGKGTAAPLESRVFCSELGAGIALSDFFPYSPFWNIQLSNEFGVDELRAFNDKCLFTDNAMGVELDEGYVNGDISFMTLSRFSGKGNWLEARSSSRQASSTWICWANFMGDGLQDGLPDLPDLPSLWCLVRTMSQPARVGVGLLTRFLEHPIRMGSINHTHVNEGHRRFFRTPVSISPNLVRTELRVDGPFSTTQRSRC